MGGGGARRRREIGSRAVGERHRGRERGGCGGVGGAGRKVTHSDCHSAHSFSGWRSGITRTHNQHMNAPVGLARSLSGAWTNLTFLFEISQFLPFSPTVEVPCCFGVTERFSGEEHFNSFQRCLYMKPANASN